MALLETSLIWIAYAVAIAIGILPVIVYIYSYQTPRDRALSVTLASIISLSCLLATLLLLPIDVALVSSTNRSRDGVRKDWATQRRVDNIVTSLKVVYYTLYSVDALLCLLVCPFTYFLYEEYDEVETEEGSQTLSSRVLGALKYTSIFVAVVIVLILAGLFVPVIGKDDGRHKDLNYFKDLLAENSGERTLSFTVGLLMSIGTILFVLYTGPGLALLPASLIKSAPALSVPNLKSTTASQLEQNRERQRQLEARNEGRQGGLEARDQRELQSLVRDERTLVRRERLAAEASGEGHALMRIWNKVGAVLRPVKLLGGLVLLLLGFVVWGSMLVTGIDKAKNSVCKAGCGYILGHINIFQPVNWIFVLSAKIFPVDYVIFLLLTLYFWAASICGISAVGIRFLWVQIFSIRKGHTSPQALLLATVMLALIVLALNYSIAMVVAPQYSTYGPQTYCDRPVYQEGKQPDCSDDRSYIKPCTELAQNPAAREICTPTVISTFINRISLNFPYFTVFNFWAQFAFLGFFLVVAITSLFRTPKLDTAELDADLEEEEEEGLLASTGRRFNATWQDITGRAARNNPAV